MSLDSLEDAFQHELKDVLSAEKQLVAALPKMAKAAADKQLQSMFKEHLEQTKGHVDRLEKVFEHLGKSARSTKCDAMAGIIEEGNGLIEEDAAPEVKDAMLIGAAQKAEHYEIATYGTLCTWAKQLGHNDALKLLKQTLNEEEETDKKLTKFATAGKNREAAALGR